MTTRGRPKGQPRTGGRAKGRPNKATADVKAAASIYTDDAIATLAGIMKDGECAPAARVAAAKEILDRAHGKSRQAVDIAGDITLKKSLKHFYGEDDDGEAEA